jgi:hypothetical protein
MRPNGTSTFIHLTPSGVLTSTTGWHLPISKIPIFIPHNILFIHNIVRLPASVLQKSLLNLFSENHPIRYMNRLGKLKYLRQQTWRALNRTENYEMSKCRLKLFKRFSAYIMHAGEE